ncbi:hypothetical protein [Arhodomonas sp. AD133]|uniref:hypothetical protein n=1 Tax=Arhodomonas sp. AD133 TaxID=3415009 RepID=UPI003EBE0353
MRATLAIAVISLWTTGVGIAGEADVVTVKAVPTGDGAYRFEVTVRHADEGRDHYANRWEVLGPDGEVVATRTLGHPHVAEQPFTRSLPLVQIPVGVDTVTVRAHDKVHRYGGETRSVALPDRRPAVPIAEGCTAFRRQVTARRTR